MDLTSQPQSIKENRSIELYQNVKLYKSVKLKKKKKAGRKHVHSYIFPGRAGQHLEHRLSTDRKEQSSKEMGKGCDMINYDRNTNEPYYDFSLDIQLP